LNETNTRELKSMENKKRTRTRLIYLALIALTIFGGVTSAIWFFAVNGNTAEVAGGPMSAYRQIMAAYNSLLFFAPMAFLFTYYFNQHQEWLVPRGARYDSSKKYDPYSPRAVVEIAVGAGIIVAFSLVKLPFAPELDFVYTGLIFVATFWGLNVGFFATIIGSTLRCLVGGFFTLADVTSCSFIDNAITMTMSLIYWKWIRGSSIRKRTLVYIGYLGLFELLWAVYWGFVYIPIAFGPWETALPFAISQIVTYAAPTLLAVIIGLAAAEAALRRFASPTTVSHVVPTPSTPSPLPQRSSRVANA
jgi:hypothetical protein